MCVRLHMSSLSCTLKAKAAHHVGSPPSLLCRGGELSGILHPLGSSTGWTLAAAVRSELSASGQASAALPSLRTPALSCPSLLCPAHVKAVPPPADSCREGL